MDDELYFISKRLKNICNLENCVSIKYLSLRNNLIEKLEGLENLKSLEHLEVYDNKLTKIENKSHLTNLK